MCICVSVYLCVDYDTNLIILISISSMAIDAIIVIFKSICYKFDIFISYIGSVYSFFIFAKILQKKSKIARVFKI